MSQVNLRIGGHAYTIGCKDGEEAHLASMAEEVERRVNRARELGVHGGEARLLVMAALFMADELYDIRQELDAARKKAGVSERGKSERLTRLAARAEEIAAAAEQH